MFSAGFCERLLAALQSKHSKEVKDKQFTAKDIHHISLCSLQFDQVPVESHFNSFVDHDLKVYEDLEFRRSKILNKEYNTIEEMSGAVAFNLTGTTGKIFKFGQSI